MTFASSTNQAPAHPSGQISVGLGWLVLLIGAAIPVFWLGFVSLANAWSTPEYSHGPLIPLISAYLFLRERRSAISQPGAILRQGPGLVVLGGALLLGIFGNLIRIPDVVTYAFILWVFGVILVCLGWNVGRHHWAPVLHLVFMLPLPQFLYWKLTIFLQLVSSELGVWFIQLAGIPVFLEGNIIDLGVYKLQVAEACSGLRYLFPILSFSYLFAILYRGPIWHKAVLLALAAPLTVFMNSFRIGMIGVLVNSYGIGQAEGFLHFFEGWVIFGACIGFLMLTALSLQRFTPSPKTLAETIDLDFGGLGGQLQRIVGIAPNRGLVLGATISALVGLAFVLTPSPVRQDVARDSFALFPHQIENWRGTVQPLAAETEAVLGASDYINASYVSPDGSGQVNIFSAWYARQTEGAGIHSPEVCLPVGGWEVSSIKPTPVSFPDTIYGDFTVNRAVIQKGLSRQIVYYWFEQRGNRMTNDYAVKMRVVLDSLTKGRSDGALVRFVTAIQPGETEAQAESRMKTFMALSLKKLPLFLPE